jgi:hypothetical protein
VQIIQKRLLKKGLAVAPSEGGQIGQIRFLKSEHAQVIGRIRQPGCEREASLKRVLPEE